MQKFFILCLLIFFMQSNIFSVEKDFLKNYEEAVLKNSMEVFIYEDFSAAPISIEFVTRAGANSQNPQNTGYYALYTKLFKYSDDNEDSLEHIESEFRADCASYKIYTSHLNFEKYLCKLAKHAFAPVFTDENIKREFDKLKIQTAETSQSLETFINAGIDSKVFSSAPWQHDSGIYPALFIKSTPEQARIILNDISKSFYIPANSAIFIRGSIKKETVLSLVKKEFEKYENPSFIQKPQGIKVGAEHRKFVLYDSRFSEDFTQIVVQYTSFSQTQADIVSSALNKSNSYFKNSLLEKKSLNIRGEEYINTAGTHKGGSSRIIIQSLLEKNEKNTAVNQAELFVQTVKNSAKNTDEKEFAIAAEELLENSKRIMADSKEFMDYLSRFWVIEPFLEIENKTAPLYIKMNETFSKAENLEIQKIRENLDTEEPFVFVLTSRKNYERLKYSFKKNGYEAINSKNHSWYMNKMYENAISYPDVSAEQKIDTENTAKIFISDNLNKIKMFTLKNSIQVFLKQNKNTPDCTIMLEILGGQSGDNGNQGFQKLMIKALAANIQRETDKQFLERLLEHRAEVKSETYFEKSVIIIETQKEDSPLCIEAVSKALIFSDIEPALADSLVRTVQSEKLIYNANIANQMKEAAIKKLYSDKNYIDAYDSTSKILANTSYLDILSAYTKFLNPSIYRIFITGNFDIEKTEQALHTNIVFSSPNQMNLQKIKEEKPIFSENKKIYIKLNRLFFTGKTADLSDDIPILVPTKKFNDPVQFWFEMPENNEEAEIFTAILLRFREMLEQNVKDYASYVELEILNSHFYAANLTFFEVLDTKKISSIYEKTVEEFTEQFSLANSILHIEKIKNSYLLGKLSLTQTNTGTALLMSEGKSGTEYLEKYRRILDTKDEIFEEITKRRLSKKAVLKIYSKESEQ